ncbi:MFS transporter [Lutibaculum baratangense]|uniref:Major facilitator superfamily (MFS) profile domain-containing protein n=1 Tax=Lutibaculum baratangense AMV1 TaxID=631454 RepID=V4REH8_9HYPH|nr:MFS transporter [Lutibaculum baratangense]ESR24541.1 hypothetical protein N177_2375 [Lutibaculum baratangense AMV1]
MTPFWKLSAAGFAATAITYGPARMGFGLFLPQFKSEFEISTQTGGLVSSLGFLGFFMGLLISQAMTNRRGPRLSIMAGLLAATVGMGAVAAAPNLAILSLGVLLAMSSAGFSWAPFNNVIHRKVEDGARPAALSLVSTGTALGIAAAGAAALLLGIGGISWRLCWAAFAIASALALLGNWMALREVAGTPQAGPAQQWRQLLQASAMPLLGIGLSYGVTSAIYISFAADRIAQAGGVSGLPASTSGSLVFICYGLFGLLGLLTGRLKEVLGLPWLLRLLMLSCALSLGLLALMPTSSVGVVASAGLQGIYVMMMSAVLAFWSERLFPALPSLSFTIVLLAVAAGSVLGPAAAGLASDALGGSPAFLGTAAIAAATAIAFRSRHIRERPEAD